MKDFDESDALERTAGDRSLLGEVIQFTLDDFPSLIVDIEAALYGRRWPEVAKLAHKAKGSAGACGAQNLYMAALELEMAARDSDENCIRFLPPMVDAFATFRTHPAVQQLSSLDAGAEASIG